MTILKTTTFNSRIVSFRQINLTYDVEVNKIITAAFKFKYKLKLLNIISFMKIPLQQFDAEKKSRKSWI